MTDSRSQRKRKEDAAATLLQYRWREYALEVRVRRLTEMQVDQAAARQACAEREADDAAYASSLPGASTRVWRVLREAISVMLVTVVLVLAAPDAYQAGGLFAVDTAAAAADVVWRALVGGAALVGAFTALFSALLALYVARWLRCFYALHSVWIGGLLATGAVLLLVRACEAWRAPLDAATALLFGWNLAVPAAVVVHWAATEARFTMLRRLYAAALAALASWLLVSLPWQERTRGPAPAQARTPRQHLRMNARHASTCA